MTTGPYGVAVGLAVVVGVRLPTIGVVGVLTVAVEVALVGLLTGVVRVGVINGVGVVVAVTALGVGGGQTWNRIVNGTHSLP